MKKFPRVLALILILALLPGIFMPVYAAVIEPSSDFYIADYTQNCVISDTTKKYIVAMNKQLEKETGAQIVVAAVDFIDGAEIEAYSYELFNEWEIGDSELNNGLLILLVIGEQNYWGIQGVGISEAMPASLIADYFNTYLEADFASAHYDSGVRSVFDAFLNWYASYYSVEFEVPKGMDAVEENNEPVIIDHPSSNTPEPEEKKEKNTEAILAVGFMLGKIAKWFLIGLVSLFVVVTILLFVLRRRNIRRRKNAGMYGRRNAVPPRNEPINGYNSLYRNSSPNGEYHYTRPSNGITYVKPDYRSGFSPGHHTRRNTPPPKNKYDDLFRFNRKPNTGANNSRPVGTRNSIPFAPPMHRSSRNGMNMGQRPSVSRSSPPRSGGGGFTRGGGAGRR